MAKEKASSTSHVSYRSSDLFCYHCGDSHVIAMPCPVDEMITRTTAFVERHKNCKKTWSEPMPMLQWSMFERAEFWFKYGERGQSSEAIYDRMMGKFKGNKNHPHDGGDFGRCHGLLKMVPEFRARLSEMKRVSQEWANLVDNWDELTLTYEKLDWKRFGELLAKCVGR